MIADQEFMVFNKDFERIGIFRNPRNLSWTEHYQNIGKMQIIADNDETGDNLNLLREGNILWRKGTETAMEIQSVETDMNETLLVIGGMSTTSIFTSRRPFGEEYRIVNVERDLYAAINASMTGKRADPCFETAPAEGLTETFETVISGESLRQIIDLTQQTDLGFKTIFDPYNKKHIFKIYKGVDRTYENSDAPVIFSNDIGFRNLSGVKTFRDKSIYKNTAIVRGQTEGNKTAEVIIGDENAGSDRFELFVDGTGVERKTSRKTVWNENGEPEVINVSQRIDDPEYLGRLRALGEIELKKHQAVETLEAEILVDDARKWNIGDIVTVKWVRIIKRGQNMVRKPELIKNIRIMSLELLIENGFCRHKITIGNQAITIFMEMELKN